MSMTNDYYSCANKHFSDLTKMSIEIPRSEVSLVSINIRITFSDLDDPIGKSTSPHSSSECSSCSSSSPLMAISRRSPFSRPPSSASAHLSNGGIGGASSSSDPAAAVFPNSSTFSQPYFGDICNYGPIYHHHPHLHGHSPYHSSYVPFQE